MITGFLSMIGGAVLGLILGAVGCAAGMSVAGGGHSHNDMFTWAGTAVLGALAGAVGGPFLTAKVLGLREQRRVVRDTTGVAPPFPRAFVASLLGAALAVFVAGTLYYYFTNIAGLPPEARG
jgi:hypothetical protein